MWAALYDPLLRKAETAGLSAWRRELLRGLHGAVVEIGAGTGLNVACYPPGLDRLVLTEPDAGMRARLRKRAPGAEVIAAPAERLPLPDRSADAVVCTLVLCSVDDPVAAVAEARRVLRPGGTLVFLEHVAAEDDRLQRALDPVWSRLTGGCHLARRTLDTIRAVFPEVEVARAPFPRGPARLLPTVRGTAR